MACEYCTREARKPLLDEGFHFGDPSAYFVGMANYDIEGEGWKLLVNFDVEVPINFCPMCGRDLRGDE